MIGFLAMRVTQVLKLVNWKIMAQGQYPELAMLQRKRRKKRPFYGGSQQLPVRCMSDLL